MLAWLRKGGVDEAILAVNHLSDRLRIEVGGTRRGSRVRLSVEEKPLGTAGPIRLARELLDPNEPFVTVNGDVVTDIDLRNMLATHIERGALATIAVASVPDPGPYGSVTMNAESRITGFEEKKGSGSRPRLINAGAYILDPEIIELIPSGEAVSMERTIFPRLAHEGNMWGWKHQGYWYDIGRIPEYIRANRELLRRSLVGKPLGSCGLMKREGVKWPTYLGKGSRFERGAQLGPDTILSDNVHVKSGSVVRDSILFEDTTVEEKCRVDGALIGERVVVGRRTRIGKGSLVAGEISIPPGSVVKENSVILT
jgi:NDP-sugar pyrophosphorylase family protein